MAEIVCGERIGGFLVLTDANGLRHALRPGAVMAASDADDSQTTTCLQCTGGRIILVHESLDQVLSWFRL